MISTLFSLVFSFSPVHVPLPVPSAADTLPFDTAQVVVTLADFTQLNDFLQATSSERQKKDAQVMFSRHMVKYPLILGDLGGAIPPPQFKSGTLISLPNYRVIADSDSIVAKGFAYAKLSPDRYMKLCRSINNAFITVQIDAMLHNGTPESTDRTSVVGQNIAFGLPNQDAFFKLVQLGLDVTSLSTQQSDGAMATAISTHDHMIFESRILSSHTPFMLASLLAIVPIWTPARGESIDLKLVGARTSVARYADGTVAIYDRSPNTNMTMSAGFSVVQTPTVRDTVASKPRDGTLQIADSLQVV